MTREKYIEVKNIMERINILETYFKMGKDELKICNFNGDTQIYLNDTFDDKCLLFEDIKQALSKEINRLKQKFEEL